MKTDVRVNVTPLGVVAVGAVVGVAYLWSQREKILAVAEDVAAKVNPVDPRNVAYGTANAVVRAATGDPNATFGTWLYDMKSKWFPSEADKAVAAMLAPSINNRVLDARDARAGLGSVEQHVHLQTWLAIAGIGLALVSHAKQGRKRGR